MQRECNYCDNHQQVNMEKDNSTGKWIVTNLDGSFHKHVKYGGSQQPQVVNMPTNPTPEYEAKITAGLRSEAIAAKMAEPSYRGSCEWRFSLSASYLGLGERP